MRPASGAPRAGTNDPVAVVSTGSETIEAQATAYAHASHGCPHEDTEEACAVCDPRTPWQRKLDAMLPAPRGGGVAPKCLECGSTSYHEPWCLQHPGN